MTMKSTILVLLAFAGSLSASENDSAESWRLLSAHCQNLYNDILRNSKSQEEPVAVDPSVFEDNLNGIESALDALVEGGELELKVIQLKIKDVEDERFGKALNTVVERLTKKYGVWVASEMAGLGDHMRFFDPRKVKPPLKLRIRLPKEEMKMFVDSLHKHELVAAENAAQQDGTEQPATRPKLKSEGGEKPQPEAEGRSR